jgi:hypothetical protein
MSGPLLEVADIFHAHGAVYRAANKSHISLNQFKVMSAIERCRTAALGGHVARCEDCAHEHIAYNSCRNRHCPKCQAGASMTTIPESTLVGWVRPGLRSNRLSSGQTEGITGGAQGGRAMKNLLPLIEQIDADIMGSDLLHADNTPIRVLDRSRRDKGLGKGVKQGRIWAYVRDQRPWAGT